MDLSQYQNNYNNFTNQASEARNNLQSFQGSMQDPLSYYNQAYQNLGVANTQGQMNTARDAVTKTNTLLSNLPQAVQGQVNGTLTNEAQRQGILAQQQAPLTQNLATQNNNYGNLASQYQNLLSQAGNQASLGYQGQQQKFSTLNDLYNNSAQQQGQALQALQFGQTYNQNAQNSAAQRAQMAAQTAAIQQQMNITKAGIDAQNAATQAQMARYNQASSPQASMQAQSAAFLNGQGANGKMWTPQDAQNLSNYSYHPTIASSFGDATRDVIPTSMNWLAHLFGGK
jgi:hypothetical protein